MRKVKRKKIESIAYGLLKNCGFEKSDFDIEMLVGQLGIHYSEKMLGKNVSGASAIENGVKMIVVNSQHSPARRRFSIAHELGHLFLHQNSLVNFSGQSVLYRDSVSSEGTDQLEIEANYFAACLLMPERLIMHEIEGRIEFDEEAIEMLARKFKVSQIAMSIRLTNLGFV